MVCPDLLSEQLYSRQLQKKREAIGLLIEKENGVSCQRFAKEIRSLVKVVKDCGWAAQNRQTSLLQSRGSSREENDQKQKLVSVRVDEAWPASRGDRDRIDEIESSIKEGAVDIHPSEHSLFVSIKKRLNDVIIESRSLRRVWAVVGLLHDGLSLFFGAAQCSHENLTRSWSIHTLINTYWFLYY